MNRSSGFGALGAALVETFGTVIRRAQRGHFPFPPPALSGTRIIAEQYGQLNSIAMRRSNSKTSGDWKHKQSALYFMTPSSSRAQSVFDARILRVNDLFTSRFVGEFVTFGPMTLIAKRSQNEVGVAAKRKPRNGIVAKREPHCLALPFCL